MAGTMQVADTKANRPRRPWPTRGGLVAALLALWLLPCAARAELQFDFFLGFEGAAREGAWFPVSFEVLNDGPPFNATVVVTGGSFNADQTRTIPVELPTNTRKRIIVPMFASGNRFNSTWTAKLLDGKGKLVAERNAGNLKVIPSASMVVAAMPRVFAGTPSIPEVRPNRAELKPEVVRVLPDFFPDNPIPLEGVAAFYINSEKALSLRSEQVAALLAWVRLGGHLIVAIEQSGDVAGTPWLRQFLPVEPVDLSQQPVERPVTAWIKSGSTPLGDLSGTALSMSRQALADDDGFYSRLPAEPSFSGAEMPVVRATIRDGVPLIGSSEAPLAVTAIRGRGRVTALLFSPDREPFLTWKQRGYFWARLLDMPGSMFTEEDNNAVGGNSVDGVIGALIDSRQIKKLPVEWLLALLVVYLAVIGPFDRWWLKRINRQMLTWITFPSYVLVFSLLIYFIGYKLRAGETEWNELNIVDVLPRGGEADLRGRSYVSIYSNSNERYPVKGPSGHAVMRGELMDFYSGGRQGNSANLTQIGDSFTAELFVPVWSSLLYCNDWFQTNSLPFAARVARGGDGHTLTLRNLLPRPLGDLRVVVAGNMHELEGGLAPGEERTYQLPSAKGVSLANWVNEKAAYFSRAVDLRRNPLGDTAGGRLEDRPLTATAASFLRMIPDGDYRSSFMAPPGLDLSDVANRGDAVIFAWDQGASHSEALNQFTPPRLQRDTLLRFSLAVRPQAE